jgi:radical SAM superfamily enzyme YgiQ (UPF0313 family)
VISRKLLKRWRELRKSETLLEPVSVGSYYILLVYPNTYSVGVSNLGFQTIFSLLNKIPFVVCDVLYYPDEDVIPQLEDGYELCSFYTERTPKEFDAIFFSVSFENDLKNVVQLLKWMGMNPLAKDRGEDDPFLLCGGIVPTSNPEPFAPLFDGVYLGEAEESMQKVVEVLIDGLTKASILEKLDKFDFIYVPSRTEVREVIKVK